MLSDFIGSNRFYIYSACIYVSAFFTDVGLGFVNIISLLYFYDLLASQKGEECCDAPGNSQTRNIQLYKLQ